MSCLVLDLFPLHPANWKQAGGAELSQLLSRDILSVQWACAASEFGDRL